MVDLATLQRELERNTRANERLEHAIRLNTRAEMMRQPQEWDAAMLTARYSITYEQLRACVEIKLGVSWRDKRTARLSLRQVLELDEIRETMGREAETKTQAIRRRFAPAPPIQSEIGDQA